MRRGLHEERHFFERRGEDTGLSGRIVTAPARRIDRPSRPILCDLVVKTRVVTLS
jgi:hypothetical protein